MMLTLFATLCASLAVFVGVGAVSGQFSFSNRRLAARTITLQRGDTKPRKDKKSIILKDDDFGGSPFVTSLLRKSGWAARRAVMLDRATPYAKVEAVIRKAAGADLQDVLLFDVYEGKGVPEGKRSLAIRLTFGRMDRTMTDAEIVAPIEAAVAALTKELGAALRS